MSKIRLIPYAAMTAAGLAALSGAAHAQSMYDINQRQDYQQDRIERGVYAGQITRDEAARLEQGERRIDYVQRRAEADGRVSTQERARIDRLTDREGREISQQSHDGQQAWDRGQHWGRTDGRPYNGWNDRDGWGGGGNWQSMRQINQQQDFQQGRIERGVYNGQITRSEATRLEQGERNIDAAQRRAEADGRVTAQERARIDRMTDRQGREIYQQSHDNQQAWDRGQGWGRTDGRPQNGWNDRDGSGRQVGWDDRGGNRGDWGRGQNDGSWNQGRDNHGWNQNGGWNGGGTGASNGGWNHNGNGGAGSTPGTGTGTGNTAGNGHTWGGNGGWNNGGTTPTGTSSGGGGHTWGGSGGWTHGGTGSGTTTPTAPATGGTAVASNGSSRPWGNWGGQARPVSATPNVAAPPRSFAAAGAPNGGGRSFGHR